MLEKVKAKGKSSDESKVKSSKGDNELEGGWSKVIDRKGKKPMVARGHKKFNLNYPSRAGKSLKIFDTEKQQDDRGHPSDQSLVHGTRQERVGGEDILVPSMDVPSLSYAVVPSISGNLPMVTHQGNVNNFLVSAAEMVGMDQSIFDFCGNLAMGTLQEEGGYLLEDVVCPYNVLPNTPQVVDVTSDDTDISFKSTQSRSSMVAKMGNMTVRKGSSSPSDSGKRRMGDADEDMASSVVKRSRGDAP